MALYHGKRGVRGNALFQIFSCFTRSVLSALPIIPRRDESRFDQLLEQVNQFVRNCCDKINMNCKREGNNYLGLFELVEVKKKNIWYRKFQNGLGLLNLNQLVVTEN